MHPGILIGLGAAALLAVALLQGGGDGAGQTSGYRRALVVGDSHSEASWTFGGRVGEKLEEVGLISVTVGNRGKGVDWYVDSGELQRQLAGFQPDLLVVALGANDAGRYSEQSYKSYLQEFVGLANDAGVRKIIWFGPSKSEGAEAGRMAARQLIAQWQRDMLPVLNVTWHDSLPLTYDLPTRDGVHYRAAEYAVWANRAESLIFDEVRVA